MKQLINYLTTEGYSDFKEIDGVLCGIKRFVFTTALVVGLDRRGYICRYCFHSKKEALDSLNELNDINKMPTGNWLKRKGEGGDLRNPNYVEQESEDIFSAFNHHLFKDLLS